MKELRWTILLGILFGIMLFCIATYFQERAWKQLEYELSQVIEING